MHARHAPVVSCWPRGMLRAACVGLLRRSVSGAVPLPHMSQPQWGAAAVVAGSNASKRRAKTVMAGPHTVLDRVDVTVSRQDQQVLDTVMAALRGGGHATVVRVAGGWVRDKLLQRPNHDLDITVDDMTGAGVAGVVHDHLVAAGEAATRVAVIQANPEQSKHLETATTKVHGKEVDFVNLRCEEYAEDSRIPTTKFGSPLDDALRRDFTVNAMFYNVNDGVIEDYTGRGFVDLKAGVIRTPLEPRTTLLDDPLRALRAVRFASRYAFTVVPELLACMASVEVRQALEDKVSRERVGSEVEGMLLSDRPIGALRMLRQVGLLSTVLTPPRLASRSELEEHITATSKKHRRGGKPSSAQQALLAYPYAPGAGGDASGEAGEGPCPEALLGAGAEVVDALENVLGHLADECPLALGREGVLEEEGGVAAAGAAAAAPTAAAAAAGGGGPVGGAKRRPDTPPPSEDITLAGVMVVVPTTSGDRLGPPATNPHAVTEAPSAPPPAEAEGSDQWQTLRDATRAGLTLPRAQQPPLLLAASLWPLRGYLSLPPARGKKLPRPVHVVTELVKVHLKLPGRLAEAVTQVQASAEALLPLLQSVQAGQLPEASRLPLALAVLQAQELWLAGLHLAAALHTEAVGVPAAVQAGNAVLTAALHWQVHRAWTVKPLLNGSDLIALQAPEGAALAQVKDAVLHWQLQNPGAGLAEAKEEAARVIAAYKAGSAE